MGGSQSSSLLAININGHPFKYRKMEEAEHDRSSVLLQLLSIQE